MAGPKGTERGTRQSLILQLGVTTPEFDGMVREDDAGGIPDQAFQYVENGILSGGNLGSRPGLVKVNTGTPLGAVRVDGIFDAGDIGAAQ